MEPCKLITSNTDMKSSSIFMSLAAISLLTAIGSNMSNAVSQSDYLTLGDDRLYYEVSGQGFPLVLVGGGSGMDLRQWDLITPTLSESYRIIRYDPRGIGKSDNPSVKYSDVADLVSLLDHLDLRKVGLIGLSSSGGFALEFAVLHPDRITGLVTAAPFVPGFQFSDSMLARLQTINQAAGQGREPFLDSMFDDAYFIPAPLDRSVRISARENMAENYDKGAGFDASLPLQLEPPLIERLQEVHSPVLLLAGELDHPEVLRRNQFLKAQISLAMVTLIKQAGHNGPLENPAAFLAAIDSFLQSIAQR